MHKGGSRHEAWIIGAVKPGTNVTPVGQVGDSRGKLCPIALSSATSGGGLDAVSVQEESNGTGIYRATDLESPFFKTDAEVQKEEPMEATDQLTRVAGYLLDAAEEMQTQGGNLEEARLGTHIFGAFVHSIRTSAGLDRGEASLHAQLDKYLWIAMEQGYVPLADLEELLPRLAKGLGVTHDDLRRVFNEALELSEA